MSTRINTNTTAFQASQNLNINSDKLSQDIQRLSTGLRINSAADDPAGLVISENLAAQSSGVTQATANSNDAINEIKTAEGALNQVQALLISIRQLAVHASNLGVNDATDVQADQAQIASAIQSINQISATTQFGTKKLLDGSATAATTTTAGTATLGSASAGFSVAAQGVYNTSSAIPAGVLNGFVATAATDTTLTSNAPVGAGATGFYQGSLTINGNAYTIGSSGTNVNLNGLNSAIASSGYTATVSSNGALTLTSASTGIPASTQSADFSGLTNYASNNAITGGLAYAAADTHGVASTVTGNATVAGAFGSVTSAVGAGVVAADAFSGSFVLNGNTVTVGAGSTVANIQTAVRALGTVGGVDYSTYTASVAANKLTLTDGIKQAEPSTADFSGLSDTTQSVAFAAAPSATTVGVAAAAAANDTVVAAYNGAAFSATTAFGGSFKVGAQTISLTGNANNLAAINTALTAAGGTAATYTASLSTTTGALTLTSTNQGTNSSYDLSGLKTYNTGALTATGGYTAALAGQASSLSATDTATVGGGTSVVTSTASSANGAAQTYFFANGLALSLASAPTSGQTTVNGVLTAKVGTSTTGQNLQYQIGGNEGQSTSQSIASTSADQLGQNTASYTDANGATQSVLTSSVADLNVTTFKGAQDAIAVIDNAISQISTTRANLGAFQTNVLQSNVTSLGVASTNLQASKSAITDTDLASQVTDYTKNQILVQAATSALSYANQLPQSVLKLLQ